MKFTKYVDVDLAKHPDLVDQVKQIAADDRVSKYRSWYGPFSPFAGWHVSWSMSYLDEEANPDSDIPDAYGNAETEDGLVFWWTRVNHTVEIRQCAQKIESEIS